MNKKIPSFSFFRLIAWLHFQLIFFLIVFNKKKTHKINVDSRIAMLKLALRSSSWVKISEWETQQSGWTRTRLTLQHHQVILSDHMRQRLYKNTEFEILLNGWKETLCHSWQSSKTFATHTPYRAFLIQISTRYHIQNQSLIFYQFSEANTDMSAFAQQ